MKKSIKRLATTRIFFISCIMLSILPVMTGANERLSSVLDGILNRYGELKGMSVNYKREITTRSMAMLGEGVASDTATGTILFMPPHYLSIRQQTPGRETVTTDGQTVWYYIEEKKAVYEYQADSLGREIGLLSEIFGGLSRISDGFDVELEEEGDYYCLRLVPDPAWDDVDHIRLKVEKKNYNIRVLEIYDLLGNITRFTLEAPSSRDDLKKDDFIFKAPSGVETIKEG